MTLRKLFLVGLSLFAFVSEANSGEDTLNTQARDAITRSLPFLWKEGQAWIDQRGCISCHQVPYMVWSLDAAASHGFEVDKDRLAKLKVWSTQIENFDNPKNRLDRTESDQAEANIDTMTHLLLALGRSEHVSDSNWQQKFADYLIVSQNENGTWKPCGQLPFQKRSKEETTDATTTWTALALMQQGKESDLKVPVEKITHNILKDGKSTEWWAAQLLLSKQRNDPARVRELTEKLVSFQNEDGGWGWLIDEESDAFGTGIAIYALRSVETTQQVEVISRAVQFLVETQTEDGSWLVRSTKAKHQKQVTPTAIYWGTAWAVIGLLEAQN